jgi:hypothetical protein
VARKIERWRAEPEEQDFANAAKDLGLVFTEADAAAIVERLRAASTVRFEAKDLLRSSRLRLLRRDDQLVAKHLKKVARGELLAPVLLVRGDTRAGVPMTVADGYHRICASFHLDEDAEIPCRLADLS